MQSLILTRNQFISFTSFKFLILSFYIAYKGCNPAGDAWTLDQIINDMKKVVHFTVNSYNL
jgi:hypothetical protein